MTNPTVSLEKTSVETQVEEPQPSDLEIAVRDIIETQFGEKRSISPYGMSKILSVVCRAKVQGPMMYNYMKSGRFPSYKTETDAWAVRRDDAIEFMTQYAVARLSK